MTFTTVSWSSVVGGGILLVAVSAYAQTAAPLSPVQWQVDLTGFYEYDTNPLRFSLGSGDSHMRLFPAADVQVPLSPRTTMFFRSAVHRDQYPATSVLNGIGVTGTAGIARRVAPRLSVWGAIDVSLSEQPDVLQASPFRFASYTQQGGSAGLVWRARSADTLRANGFAVRRQYRGLSSPLLPVSSSQIDPVLGLGGSWTHGFGGERAAWTRLALNTTWHQSNNRAYSYVLPSISGAWGTNAGRRSTLRLDGTLAWLRYDARRVGRSSVLRKDTIAEIGATAAWRRGSRVEPFLRVIQQWDRSTDPLRNFSDSRVLVGARVNVWAGGRRRADVRRPRPSDLTDDTALTGVRHLGPGDSRHDALAKVDLSYAHIKAARWADAADAARAAVALDPANATAWANLGVALYKLGDVLGARRALERSLALNPGNEQLRSLLTRMPPS
jgi:hypothetical protein